MREDSICRGGKDHQRSCHQASTVHCLSCGYEWDCEDTGGPDDPIYIRAGHCASCGSSGITLNRCEDCPILDLEIARSTSHAGRLLNRVLDLDFAFEHRIPIGDLPVTVEEFEGLKILSQERGKKQIEDQRTNEEKAIAERAKMEAMQREGGGRRGM